MKKNNLPILILSAAMLLVACGGGSSQTPSENSTTPSISETSTPSETSVDSTPSETDSQAPVISITITGATVLASGATTKLIAEVINDDAGVDWTSSDKNIAKVDANGEVTALVLTKDSEVTITATSVTDPTIKAHHKITVLAEEVIDQPVGRVVFTQGDNPTEITTANEQSGAFNVTVKIDNLPEGVTEEKLTYTWPLITTMTDFHAKAGAASNVYEMVVLKAGMIEEEVLVKISEELTISVPIKLEVTRKLELYEKISTKEDFINLLTERNAVYTGRYILENDIDLEGYEHTENFNTTFNGTLDGNGHKIENFTVKPATGADGGLFFVIPSGLIRNIHFVGNVNAPSGFSGVIAKELNEQSIITDSIFETTDTTAVGVADWTWQRNGAVGAMLRGTLKNTVTKTINPTDNRMLATFPYSHGNRADAAARATIKNVYTNLAKDLSMPFGPDPSQGWNSNIPEQFVDIKYSIDYSTSLATDFDLNPNVFVLEDGKMPTLKLL